MRFTARDRRGFTLIELVVVIAILGVLAAISVPMVTSYLSQSKQRAYDADVARVQASVDAYYSSPDNVRWAGGRQYPIKGAAKASTTPADLFTDGTQSDTIATSPKNPLGGTKGGDPVWVDDGNGIRDASEEVLKGPAVAGGTAGWRMATAVRQGTTYYVDTRDYIIDMTMLTGKALIDGVPGSASSDSGGTGSYTYYVDANGKVQTLLATFPTSAKTGFQGVFP